MHRTVLLSLYTCYEYDLLLSLLHLHGPFLLSLTRFWLAIRHVINAAENYQTQDDSMLSLLA